MRIIYENKNLVVIDKPAGLLVHPTDKNEKDTLMHQISEKWPEIKKHNWQNPSRAGIVHRLDKDTSGLIIIAKNPKKLEQLQEKFKNHKIKKVYYALVAGKVEPKCGKIITQILRDKKGKSVKQKISNFNLSWEKGKEAQTNYKVLNYYKYKNYIISLLELEIKTGRTHQIRAHLKHKNWPIIGDQIYTNKLSKKISKDLKLSRQFLHSKKLEFEIEKDINKVFSSPLTQDLINILDNFIPYTEI